ncbi:hypothetical protein BU107_13990 [Staphylococcus xylosus]|uniref:hypothetical protein n=1 Tax=Staphylococcus xylosus TaxID=1288 RepID=UPI000E6A4AED|nr:hypothetical protein [Staphylococcus xylosus]RIM82166.1 hypothetical protein BU107_13990 [Staphylococcus xylosus]
MKAKINLISLILSIISFITYYSTFHTTFYINENIAPWFFPGAILFMINIVISIAGILNATKWFNIIFLLLSIFYLLNFSLLLFLI